MPQAPTSRCLIKGNRGRGSREIAHFHTTALAGDDETADAAMAQAGIHRVRNLREMIDGLKIFSLPPLAGPNLAIITRSGGHGVLAADGVERYGFRLAEFPEALMDKIGENKAHIIRMTNPLERRRHLRYGYLSGHRGDDARGKRA